jgi:hypothetical protein
LQFFLHHDKDLSAAVREVKFSFGLQGETIIPRTILPTPVEVSEAISLYAGMDRMCRGWKVERIFKHAPTNREFHVQFQACLINDTVLYTLSIRLE